jgi:hypothetical protein
MTKSLVRGKIFEQGYQTIIFFFFEKYDLSVWIEHLFE